MEIVLDRYNKINEGSTRRWFNIAELFTFLSIKASTSTTTGKKIVHASTDPEDPKDLLMTRVYRLLGTTLIMKQLFDYKEGDTFTIGHTNKDKVFVTQSNYKTHDDGILRMYVMSKSDFNKMFLVDKHGTIKRVDCTFTIKA